MPDAPAADAPVYSFGWLPDSPDARDYRYAVIRATPAANLLDVVDMRNLMPAVEDQGRFSSCVANALTSAIEFLQLKAGKKHEHNASRMFVYYNARALDNLQNQDGGCMIRSAIKSTVSSGDCRENKWQYTAANLYKKPGFLARWNAQTHLVTDYHRVEPGSTDELKAALTEGYPVVFGTRLYGSFMNVGKDGMVPMPDEAADRPVGQHAMLLCGYNATHFMVLNSWGKGWGDNGYCYIPCEYFIKYKDFSQDFWVVNNATLL